MQSPSVYRDRARECVELAQTVKVQDRVLLLQIAEAWLWLADKATEPNDVRPRTSDALH